MQGVFRVGRINLPECSSRRHRNINLNFIEAGKRQMDLWNKMQRILLPCDARGFSIEQFQSTGKMRIMSSGVIENAI